MRRIQALALTVATVVATTIFGTGQPALAADPPGYSDCVGERVHPKATGELLAGGNNYTDWAPNADIYDNDAFKIRAEGSITIDWWGNRVDVAGVSALAPTGWPLAGERQYMLIAKVNTGRVFLQHRSRWYYANQWFPVGANSGCLWYDGTSRGTYFTFSYNDITLNDNGGNARVVVQQWW